MLHTLVMAIAKEAVDALLVFEIYVTKNTVSFHDLVQDVEVEW